MQIITQADTGEMGLPCFPGDLLKYFKELKFKAVNVQEAGLRK